MSKKNTKVTMKFQHSHSRNVNDWTVTKLDGGRTAFIANEEGVNFRIGLLMSYLGDNGASTTEDMGAYLQTVHKSYRNSDVSQPMKQMFQAGMVSKSGTGRNTTYKLTSNAKRIYTAARKVWIGKGGK